MCYVLSVCRAQTASSPVIRREQKLPRRVHERGGEGGEEKGGQPEAEVINDPPPLYMEVFIMTNIHPNSKSQEESWP